MDYFDNRRSYNDRNGKIITGDWNGQPIYRTITPEEKLKYVGIKPEVANLFIETQKLQAIKNVSKEF